MNGFEIPNLRFTGGLPHYLGENDLLKGGHVGGFDPLRMHAAPRDTVPQANVGLDVQDGGLWANVQLKDGLGGE